jgi:hypothetical protein
MDGTVHADCLNAHSDFAVQSPITISTAEPIKMPDLSVSADSSAVKGVGGDSLQDEPIDEKAPTSPRFGQLITDTECKLADLNLSDGRRSVREDRKHDDEDNSEDEYYDISSEASNDLNIDKQFKANVSDKMASSQESIIDLDEENVRFELLFFIIKLN